MLRQPGLQEDIRVGALRLIGFLAEPILESAVEESWRIDRHKANHLADYLWAAAECCGDNPEHLLGPVCDAWAALSDEQTEQGMPSPRNSIAGSELSWAFARSLPTQALRYFIRRAQQEDLRWPITYMFHGVDHPDAVAFVAQELAAITRQLEGTDGFSHFAWNLPRDWERRQQERGEAMSSASRATLKALWISHTNNAHLRRHAFRLWAATQMPDDLELLQSIENPGALADDFLRARLTRGDDTAIPGLIMKLNSKDYVYWWQMGREIWSDSLTDELKESLKRRSSDIKCDWGTADKADWIISELVVRLSPAEAEQLLAEHWDYLQYSPFFVQAALYTATPSACKLASLSLTQCPDQSDMLKHISTRFGVPRRELSAGRNITQLEALVPYMDSLSPIDVYCFWELCNKNGCLEFRRAHLDHRLREQWRDRAELDNSAFNLNLDREISFKHHYANYWVERHLVQGEKLGDIISRLGNWLKGRRSVRALEFAADVVAFVGERKHLQILDVSGIEPMEEAQAIIADAQFAVCLRSLI